VASTQKITKAMKMVAAAKLRRAQQAVEQSRPYSAKVEELLTALAPAVPTGTHPLLGGRPVEKRALVVMSSDRGLCGSFNSGILRRAEKELRESPSTTLIPLGKKATVFFTKRNAEIFKRVDGFWHSLTYQKSEDLLKELAHGYLEGQFDRVDVLYNEFVSVISQKPKLISLLPIPAIAPANTETKDFIFEPGRDEIVKALVPKVIGVRFYAACLNSQASEHGARMTSMDSATRNASEMIDSLTLTMNRVRQATITKELMEIISGAEALK
jgi:F-type H+-transporting ATPase subunit gamma